ncbi:MAG: zinc-dependent peptidase [Bacteroidota bacterium]
MFLSVEMPELFLGLEDLLLVCFGLFVGIITLRWFFMNRTFLINRFRMMTGVGRDELYEKLKVLLVHNSFYRSLDKQGKQKMLDRCARFAMQKRFLGSNDFVVNGEMVALISATAVRLTYGLDRFDLPHYHTIRIFPSTFFSPFHKRDLKGGASAKGILFFSWSDLVQGESIENDRINLGLHEMAHALRMELRYGSGADRRVADYFDSWFQIAFAEFQRVREGDESYLRDYAGTNVEEFFAVCVEHFFEDAEHFCKELPDVYAHLCLLLNQDPLNKTNGYAFDRELVLSRFPGLTHELPNRIQRSYRYDSWHWSFNMILAGFFLFLPIVLYCISTVSIRFSDVLIPVLMITMCAVAFRSFWYQKGIQLYRHLFMFALVGISFPGLALLLIVNMNFHSNTAMEYYSITDHSARAIGEKIRVVYYLDPKGDTYPKRFRQVDLTIGQSDFVDAQQMVMETSEGIIGWRNIHRRSLILNGYHTIQVDRPEL